MKIKKREIKKVRIKGKVFEAEICDSILSRARGLMFRRKPKNLLFVFRKPTRQSIHSLFCKPFLAVWMYNGRIIDEKIVQPFQFSIKPEKSFTEIVEIPLKNDNKLSASSSEK